MTEPTNGNTVELKRIVRMLEKTVEMAEDAELTGSLAERSTAAVRSYNTTVNHLISTGQIPSALFGPLPGDANLTDVAMSSAQLAEYLRAGLPEEEEEERHKGPRISRNLTIGNINLGPGSDSDELSQMIRDRLSEWFGEARPAGASEEGQGTETAQTAPSGSAAPASPQSGPRRAALPQQARVEEVQAEPRAAEARRQ